MPLGFSAGDLLRLVREAREGIHAQGPLLVIGPLAEQLARLLAAGGDAGAVRTAGQGVHSAAVVCVLTGPPRDDELAILRPAARASVPLVGVQTGDPATRVPYIPAGDIVDCRSGRGFPVDEIAGVLARVLGHEAAAQAARLPVLRPTVVRHLVLRTAGRAAGIAASPRIRQAHLPLLVLMQAQMLREVAAAEGRPAPRTPQELGVALGPELAGALATGIAGRSLSRALPWAGAAGRAAIAFGGTAGLGSAGAGWQTLFAGPTQTT